MIFPCPSFILAALVVLHPSTPSVRAARRHKSKLRSDSWRNVPDIYMMRDSFSGGDFYGWNFETMDDPTNGRVNYLSMEAAMAANLTYVVEDRFFMHVDSSQVVAPGERGRDSIRIKSDNAYGDCVFIASIKHMPEGCGTWGAWWTLSKQGPWPSGGEIDIVEGVNLDNSNRASMHTSPGCTVDVPRYHSGTSISTDCDAKVNSNQGCGTIFNSSRSFGVPFNNAGGGIFAMQKSPREGIRVWFWPHFPKTNIPGSILRKDSYVSVSSFGQPDAHFPCSDNCDCERHFDDHQMIFNTALCGDWAGSVFGDSKCGPASCKDFVDNNPEAFKRAYWEINYVNVYCRS